MGEVMKRYIQALNRPFQGVCKKGRDPAADGRGALKTAYTAPRRSKSQEYDNALYMFFMLSIAGWFVPHPLEEGPK